jgi:glutamate--cysteine ligase
VPSRWRAAPVTLLAGLLYDDRARAGVCAVMERHRHRLPALLRRAAIVGVADPVLCALAVEAWSLALAGARRLPRGFVATRDVARTEAFLDRFTVRGRCPSDELRERLATSPASALAWAAEPAEEMSTR